MPCIRTARIPNLSMISAMFSNLSINNTLWAVKVAKGLSK
jgi:hypothetical protein